MTRTRPGLLALLALGAGVVAIALQLGLGAVGLSKIVPQVTLAVTLVLIAVVVVVIALPVRRATRAARDRAADAPPRPRVDPFYATRVVLIAKASAVTGSLLGGAAAGLVGELLIRPVSAASSVWAGVAMLVGSVLLLVAGLLAEGWCVLPPDDEDQPPVASHP
ncbi:DUF3180 family protein [Protaetiibacter sp. SSC-01]|uniref:DUF3180 family protein n=1 Tax=Protaetiibacter sp. SSC-01 TaxID=2759943 RepID=UPI001656F166|nr:DUF3180 family protein [Protaetiibacter sp. SSC-01]QNO37645.1 DUF3180 family protein [Protaetiibacter sp. SSC-01]